MNVLKDINLLHNFRPFYNKVNSIVTNTAIKEKHQLFLGHENRFLKELNILHIISSGKYSFLMLAINHSALCQNSYNRKISDRKYVHVIESIKT